MAAATSLKTKFSQWNSQDAAVPLNIASDEMADRGVTELHFVVSSNLEKPDPELRKLIRSHVMQGKNQGRKLPPRKRKTKAGQDLSDSGSDACAGAIHGSSTLSTTVVLPTPVLTVTIPRSFCSGMSTINFADTLEPGTIEVVLQLSSIAKQMLFPLERCMFFDRRSENWIAPLAVDPAYLHAMIFTAQFYFDALKSNRPAFVSRRSMPHFVKTLKLLRERMADEDDQESLSDSTAASIMALIGHANLTGDLKSARYHMEGLYKIVYLRGGVNTFKQNAKLLVEILRCDLGIALHCGSKPIFFSPSRQQFQPYPDLTPLLKLIKPTSIIYQDHSTMFLEDIDNDLAQAWTVISNFCSIINFAVDSELRISTETFLDTMASVVYRLLNMHFEAHSKDEIVRLGLIAFLCSVFLQWKHLGMSYPHFTSMFRKCFVGVAANQVPPELMIWLLIVGTISVFDEMDDSWLKSLLKANISLCGIEEWSEAQEVLKGFLWIGLVYDKPGKRVFESAVA